MTRLRQTVACIALLAAFPEAAIAHTGIGAIHGFFHGFVHPLSGADHLVAMLMVGVLAYQLGGRALWLLPIAFISVMTIGAALGVAGVLVPFVEISILLSCIALGILVSLGLRLPVGLATATVSVFAVFHGYAHGSEIPENIGGLTYAASFISATSMLHVLGVAGGMLLDKSSVSYGDVAVRSTGVVAILVGAILLSGL